MAKTSSGGDRSLPAGVRTSGRPPGEWTPLPLARFGALAGRSRKIRELMSDLEQIAPTDMTLLIEGETGTGKDLVAEAVHLSSGRARGPYVVFDCGAVPPTLIESELFGHERGAFTGATIARPGIFEQAHGGTVFLDELGELPKELQPRLLRVLEKRENRRVGSGRSIPVDVRVIAATNRDLAAEVQRGNFREDLYFRIAAARVVVPPLRERLEDLSLLVERFLAIDHPHRSAQDLPPELWELFFAHPWPGNVRELRNVLQTFVVTPDRVMRNLRGSPLTGLAAFRRYSQGNQRRAQHTPHPEIAPLKTARQVAKDDFEREYLRSVLAAANGNVRRAASLSGISRQMLQRLIRKHRV
jgi:transcriptional regulator with GAF, ATPase, and Fis domain